MEPRKHSVGENSVVKPGLGGYRAAHCLEEGSSSAASRRRLRRWGDSPTTLFQRWNCGGELLFFFPYDATLSQLWLGIHFTGPSRTDRNVPPVRGRLESLLELPELRRAGGASMP